MRGSWSSGQALFGLALVALGVLFLAQNYLGVPIDNWWAALILVPALGSFWAAWIAWRLTGNGYAAAGPVTGGLLMLAFALIFLLNLSWSQIWPVFIVILGVGALLPSLLGGRPRRRGDV